ncbi:ParE-like toxin of type II ParDE toxin-antitoxin system [Mangrovibacterium marinum]|uniref:ParE-like toxin of type II ParDE toxin-antitoxin system n=1 Tax=Mangrovibacterium marinum TaxID=1639118 RepID=A0A2T5C062_9BACT|nr:type II toxin-antitoxin system RelE/ParE family toxin [Mangrovibacterium marinum]PTN07962.1 ParE-like toxin of type II ParDE toxin-antitoxin system [Mangrovibacterium marinum]
MIVEFRNSFLKDIKRVKQETAKKLIKRVIRQCEQAETIRDISHCEPLQSRGKYFKIKHGQYRFGIHIDKGIIEFLKFGTRQRFYDDFPPF